MYKVETECPVCGELNEVEVKCSTCLQPNILKPDFWTFGRELENWADDDETKIKLLYECWKGDDDFLWPLLDLIKISCRFDDAHDDLAVELFLTSKACGQPFVQAFR